MLSIAICDDEIRIQQALASKIGEHLKRARLDAEIATFSRGEDLLSRAGSFDVVLLDIEMDGINGMQAAQALRGQGKECEIIFVTSHSSYVYEAFGVDASNFLLKPVAEQKLFAAVDKALNRVLKDENAQYLLVKKGGDIAKIRFSDILFCEIINHRLVIHTSGGAIDYYENIATLEKKLSGSFFRSHRSYIINLKNVVSFEKDRVGFHNGEHAFVSRRNAAELSQRLLEAIRGEVV